MIFEGNGNRKMKLYCNRTSPYGRKVLVVVQEKKLTGHIELCDTDPWSDPPGFHAEAPIGKIPALVTDDGLTITESTTICQYLDEIGGRPSLIGGDRSDVMARAALAQGLIDAAFAIVIERRRPTERQWPEWINRQRRAIERTLPMLAFDRDRFDFGDISFACGLAYLDFRLAEINWRRDYPLLAAWLDHVGRRPSMRATTP